MTKRRFVIFGSISDDASFIHFGIKSRLIRINERSAAGDPLEEFPKGNCLRRLKGAFVVCVGCARSYLQRVRGAF